MKVIKYPKWKKKVECKICGTQYIISSKDILTRKISTTDWPLDCHKAHSYCPFCSEKNTISIQEFYKESIDEDRNKIW